MTNFNKTMKLIAESEERAKTDRIELDSVFAKELGFTSDKFDGYLWKNGEYITISFIVSKQEGKGNLSRLFKTINEKGYKIEVPTPFANMELILICHGFKKTIINDPLMGKVEVWQQKKMKWIRDYTAIDKLLRKAEKTVGGKQTNDE